MCQSQAPLFILYSYISVIILSLATALSILFRDKKCSTNRNAFYFILVIILWTIGDLVQWTANDPLTIFIFMRLSYLADFFFLFFLYFAYDLVEKELSWKKKLLFALPLLSTLIAVFGGFGVGNFDQNACYYDIGWYIFPSLFLNLVYSIWASIILIKKYPYDLGCYKSKSQVRMLVFAIMFFVLWNLAYEAIDVLNVTTGPGFDISSYFILGNLFFVFLIAFCVIEYDLFDFGVVPRKWLMFTITSVIFGGMFILSQDKIFSALLVIFYVSIVWMFWRKVRYKFYL